MKRWGDGMLRKLYHGSKGIIEKPVFGYGKPYNDYGIGFYCTDQLAMAKEWAVRPGQDGYASCYELDDEGLSILNLNGARYTILHWLAILLQHRTFEISSALALEAKEYLGDVFLPDYETKDIMNRKMQRDRSARREYLDTERNRRQRSDLYIMQILDEEVQSDDARLR